MTHDTPAHEPAAEEQELCVGCLTPNTPNANFCTKCGAPLSSYASTGPFEQLLSEGAVYRQAAEQPRRLVVVIGVWVIFGGMAAMGALLLLGRGQSGFMPIAFGIGMLAISGAMIGKTTWNYMARGKPETKDAGSAPDLSA